MSARGTYEHIGHLYRMFARAIENNDKPLAQVMVRLLSNWNADEPKIAKAAREAALSRGEE